VVDTDGEQLFEALKCGVDLVKPNLEELKSTLKVEINNKDDLLAACRKLIAMGTKIVLVSLGKKGAVITDGQKSYYSKSINVAVNSTLGAGDAMVAAATNALIQHESLPNILRAGVAAGTAAVTLPDSISFKKSKFDEILATLDVKEI
jgi:fructose-1-phosphate kinase PfkB-like protein